MLPINSTAHQLERVTVRCLTLLLKLYSNHTVFMLDDYKGQKVNDISKMRCSLSNFPGKDIYFVQNKSLSSDMQVSRTQRGSFASSCRFNYWPVADSNPILQFIMIENVQTIQ